MSGCIWGTCTLEADHPGPHSYTPLKRAQFEAGWNAAEASTVAAIVAWLKTQGPAMMLAPANVIESLESGDWKRGKEPSDG